MNELEAYRWIACHVGLMVSVEKDKYTLFIEGTLEITGRTLLEAVNKADKILKDIKRDDTGLICGRGTRK